MKPFDHAEFRSQFPALNGSIVYLDSAATALKPQAMIDATIQYYSSETSNTLRGSHHVALTNTARIERARQLVADLINAPSSQQIIWTSGATESINLIAYSYGLAHLSAGDEMIVCEMEHHSNLIPWLRIAELTGAKIITLSASEFGLSYTQLELLMSPRTKIVALTQMSNVTGYDPDLVGISNLVHYHGAKLVIDGAQGAVHHPLDVTHYHVDFYAFSAHKLYGPTGLGVLYVKASLLEKMPIWKGGGKMVDTVTNTTYNPAPLPYKFEAGTPNIAGIIGFGATLEYLNTVDMHGAEFYNRKLSIYAWQQLESITGIQFYSEPHRPIITFNIDGIHHSDIATLLAEQNIALRNGEFCAQPLMRALNCDGGALRISLMPYNNTQDIDKFIAALQNSLQILS